MSTYEDNIKANKVSESIREELNLYLFDCGYQGYDTFDSWLVAEVSEEEAKKWSPYNIKHNDEYTLDYNAVTKITPIAKAVVDIKPGVLIASFNAG